MPWQHCPPEHVFKKYQPRTKHHVPPREPLAKHELDTIFEGTVVETPNLQGRCTLVWHMCHASDDLDGSKLCPQGTISFSALCPLAPTPFDEISPNLVRGCSAARAFKKCNWGSKKLGGQNFEFSDFYFHHFWANYVKIHKNGGQFFSIFWREGVKIFNFRKIRGNFFFDFRNLTILDTRKYEIMLALRWAKVTRFWYKNVWQPCPRQLIL